MVTARSQGRNLGLGLGDVPALAMVAMMLLRREEPQKAIRPRPLLERAVPRISVVIPCWDEHAGLARSIRSILAQDYPSTEIIVVHQGTEDALRGALGELGQKVAVLTSPREDGEIGAIKAGFDVAGGEYLICLPPGDLLMPGALDRVRRTVWRKSYRVMWFCEMEDCEHAGERARPASPQPGVSVRSLLRGPGPHPSAIAIRRSVYQKVAGTIPTARLTGVRDLWFRLACRTRFRRIEGSLGCRCASARAIGETDAERHAREFERSVACLTRQMRWTCKVMGVFRHVLARIDDAYRWVRNRWTSGPSQPSRLAHGAQSDESLLPAGPGERAEESHFAGRDCLPG